jgi:16S rRNA (guanine527-N7)-methyltransferase
MDSDLISKLLQPFVTSPLSEAQLRDISTYIDVLLRWNQKLNLTAVRDPEQIVTRHFGESIFAAGHLFAQAPSESSPHLVDVGSGAGFPGIPMKLCFPFLRVELVESHQKKATFLREIIRQLGLTGIDVFAGRAETIQDRIFDVVTLRAVERFDDVLPVAAKLLNREGRLALLVGEGQISAAATLLPSFRWQDPVRIPISASRVLLIGRDRRQVPCK